MCMHCCGRDHFGNCLEKAKCFVCADSYEGAKHKCNAEGCGKKTEPCEHHAARCANCEGPHMATLRRCPEKRSSRQTGVRKPTDIRSSPPTMDTELEQDDLPSQGGQTDMDSTPSESERAKVTDAIAISSNIDVHSIMPRDQSLPRLGKEVRSLTKSFIEATQPYSSSDPTHMSIDDDSASAQLQRHGGVDGGCTRSSHRARSRSSVLTGTTRGKEVYHQPSKLPDTVAGVCKARHKSDVGHLEQCTRPIRVRGENGLGRQPARAVLRRLGDSGPQEDAADKTDRHLQQGQSTRRGIHDRPHRPVKTRVANNQSNPD